MRIKLEAKKSLRFFNDFALLANKIVIVLSHVDLESYKITRCLKIPEKSLIQYYELRLHFEWTKSLLKMPKNRQIGEFLKF